MVYPDSERLTYGYDAGGLVNFISGEEDGFKKVLVGTDPVTGSRSTSRSAANLDTTSTSRPAVRRVPRRRYDVDGNGVTTESHLRPQHAVAHAPGVGVAEPRHENQGRRTRRSRTSLHVRLRRQPDGLPQRRARRCLTVFTGPAKQTYTYDPYERVVGASEVRWQQVHRQAAARTTPTATSRSTNRGNVTVEEAEGLDPERQARETYPRPRRRTRSPAPTTRPAPHQATGDASARTSTTPTATSSAFSDAKGKWLRAITWDAADRMRTVDRRPVDDRLQLRRQRPARHRARAERRRDGHGQPVGHGAQRHRDLQARVGRQRAHRHPA